MRGDFLSAVAYTQLSLAKGRPPALQDDYTGETQNEFQADKRYDAQDNC